MKVFSVPAIYAPAIEAAIGSVMRDIERDIKLREMGSRNGSYVSVDESRAGSIVVVVGSGESRVLDRPPIGVLAFRGPSKELVAARIVTNESRAKEARL